MQYPPQAAQVVLNMIENDLKQDLPPDFKLRKLCWNLMNIRANTLSKDLVSLVGETVLGGPFKGLKLTQEALGQYMSPYILGTYEHELHPTFEKIIASDYKHILNIGCSVGYYAVGLARRMPHMVIEAFDTDPEARRKCADMAQLNGVEDHVQISGQFEGEHFANYTDGKTLVLMDIETAETTLLDPEKYPALKKMDIVVELHDLMDHRISGLVSARFTDSHNVEIIANQNHMPDVSNILPKGSIITPFDQMLLGWECRDGPTPWGVFIAKQH